MDVAVDAARKHQQPGGIDLAGRFLDLGGNRDDASLPDADIGAKCVGSRDNGTATNSKIQLRHCALLSILLRGSLARYEGCERAEIGLRPRGGIGTDF